MAHSSESLALIQQIEATAKRPITIQTTLTASSIAQCHPQQQSPLFAVPAELRDIIFRFATSPYYAPDTLLAEHDLNYRPDHQAKWVTSVSLLATCRRVWLETNHLPMLQGHHCFFLPEPEWDWTEPKASTVTLENFATKLTRNNRPLLQHMRVFVNDQYLNSHMKYALPPLLSTAGACPEILTLTIRHIDWWHWQINNCTLLHGPRTSPAGTWLAVLLNYQASPRLRELRLELEALESRVFHLRLIIDFIRKSYAFVNRVDEMGSEIELELQHPDEERTWSGPTNLDNREHPEYAGRKRLDYRIVTLVWKARAEVEVEGSEGPVFSFSDADEQPQGKLGPEDAAVRRQWEERWEREGSLLRFVE